MPAQGSKGPGLTDRTRVITVWLDLLFLKESMLKNKLFFWNESKLHHFSPPASSEPLSPPYPILSQIHGLVFFVHCYNPTVLACMPFHLVCIPSVICIPYHLVLNNQQRLFPRADNSSPSQHSKVACSPLSSSTARWDFSLPSLLTWMSIGVILVQVLPRQPYCWDFMGTVSLTFLGDVISKQVFRSLCSYSLPAPSSAVIPEPWVQELQWRCTGWGRAPRAPLFSAVWLVVAFRNGLHLLQWGESLMIYCFLACSN